LLLLIPAHVTTALFASVAADTADLAQRVRFTLTACLAIGVPAVVATIVLAGPLLRPLGPGYAANGAICLRILVLAYVPFTIKMHAVAIARAQQRLRSTSRWLALAAVVEAGAAAVAAEMWGVIGLAAAIAIAFCVEGTVCLPMVWHLVGRRAQPGPVSLLGTRIPQPLHRQIRDTGPGAMNGVSRLVP
jgi:O-antigen/teichoic acid export membrane protein